jgi:hypothetical protein
MESTDHVSPEGERIVESCRDHCDRVMDPAELAKHEVSKAKAMWMILDSMRDHLIPHLSKKIHPMRCSRL